MRSKETPEVHGPSTGTGRGAKRRKIEESNAGEMNFDDGDDFIPFATFDTPPPSETEYDKRREYSRQDLAHPVRERDQRGERDERYRESNSEKDSRRKGKIRERSRERDSDRHRGKRKSEPDASDDYDNKQRTGPSSRKAPWVENIRLDRYHNVAQLMHHEVEAFLEYISPTPAEDKVRGLIVELISRAVTQAFPDATVYPFGSYQTKLYLPSGDIDLVIVSDSMAYSKKVAVLSSLANTLKRAKITSRVSIIANAKVPIIKFVTTHGRFNVDISINQENGVAAGKIINGFLEDMHGTGKGLALRSLIMITKLFLSQRNMNEVFTGGLGSYSIVCLAVSFLQMHPKIRRGEIDSEKNLGVLVIEFFELYGCYFNYDEVGISVQKGGTYFSKRQRGWLDFRKNHLLSIEDPTDPSNDISRGSYGMAKIRTTFAGAHGILTAAAYMCAGVLGSRKNGRTHHFRRRYHPEDLSVLSSIVGVTQEIINHRRFVQELHDAGTLQALLGLPKDATASQIPEERKHGDGKVRRTANDMPPPASAMESIRSTWEGVGHMDKDRYADARDENGDVYRSRKRIEDEDEEGRYGIVRHRNKRTKNDRDDYARAVFTTDEEADELLTEYAYTASESQDGIDTSGVDDRGSVEIAAEVEKRRSFWLAKGIHPSNDSD